jgi:hypothetical protein
MAALLPGASSSFSVVSHKDKLAVKIENIHMKDYQERSKFLKARIPKVYEVQLGKLLQATSSKLKKQIESASLVLVRSQEIDAEGGEDWLARQLMDSVIGNIARAIKNQLNKSQVKAISDIKIHHQKPSNILLIKQKLIKLIIMTLTKIFQNHQALSLSKKSTPFRQCSGVLEYLIQSAILCLVYN